MRSGASVYVSSLQDLIDQGASAVTSGAVTFGGWANFNLSATLSLNGDPNFPSIGTTITMTWSNLANPSSLSFSFGNMTLDLGTFFSNELGPVLGDIKQYIQPIEDVINVLQKPIPGIDTLPGMSTYDIIDALEQFDGSTGYEIASIATFINDLNSLVSVVPSASGGSIDFGSYSLAGQNLTGPDAVPSAVQNLANGVPGPGALSNLSTADLDNASSYALSQIENDPASLLQMNGNQGSLGSAAPAAGTMVGDNSVVSFPVLDDPSSLLGMLFGQDVNLVTVNLPFNITNQSFGTGNIFIPILGPLGLNVSFNANFSASGDLDVGYDTQGLRDALANPSGNIPNDFLDGFYIQGPTGTLNTPGYDPGTSLTLNAGLNGAGGGELNLDVGSASLDISGGLNANLNVTMNPGIEENGSGGKIRLNNLTSNLSDDFAASGYVTANVNLTATLSFLTYSHTFTIVPLDNVTLWNSTDANLGNAPGQKQPAPSVYGLSATAGPLLGGNQITIYGENLENASSVNFGEDYYGQNMDIQVTPYNISPTSIDVTVPASGFNVPYWTANLTVTTPGGQAGFPASEPYTYDPVPVINSVGPATALGGGGSLEEIEGSGLLAVTSVDFGGSPGILYTDVSHPSDDQQIWAYAPGGSGTVSVTVASPGSTTTGGSITYEPQPEVTGISPTAGPANVSTSAGEILTIDGENFGYDDDGTYVGTASGVLFGYTLRQTPTKSIRFPHNRRYRTRMFQAAMGETAISTPRTGR